MGIVLDRAERTIVGWAGVAQALDQFDIACVRFAPRRFDLDLE